MPFYLGVLPKYEASPPQIEIPETMSPTHLLLEYLPWELVTHSCHWHTCNLTSLWPREEMKTGSQKMSAFHVCCSIIHNCWEQMKADWQVNGQGKWSLHTFGLKEEGNLLFVTVSEISQAWIHTHECRWAVVSRTAGSGNRQRAGSRLRYARWVVLET